MNTERAGFWIRLLAAILDGIIIGVIASILNAILGIDVDVTDAGVEGRGVQGILEFLYMLIVPVIWVGYTIGKRITGIRIVKVDGSNVTIGTMLMRTLVSGIVYVLTLGIGLIVNAFMVGIRQDRRAIHDFIAGTYVTKSRP